MEQYFNFIGYGILFLVLIALQGIWLYDAVHSLRDKHKKEGE